MTKGVSSHFQKRSGTMKLVLSRKGFDAGSGGRLSPYDETTGRYVWLPIPERKEVFQARIRYDEIPLERGYLGSIGTNVSDVYQEIYRTSKIKVGDDKREIDDPDIYAHFDPMLGRPPWVPETSQLQIGKGFGQANAAPHLRKMNVADGDLFLFFGGFKAIGKARKGHFLYGWMKVKKRIETYGDAQVASDEYGLERHPHVTKDAFSKLNYVYVPDEWLFKDLGIPGCGYFTTLNEGLRLSDRLDGRHGTWRLPSFLYQNISQVHHSTWQQDSDSCTVSTGIGQEFVCANPGADGEAWIRELFVRNEGNVVRAGVRSV